MIDKMIITVMTFFTIFNHSGFNLKKNIKISIIDTGVSLVQMSSARLCKVYDDDVKDDIGHGKFMFDIIGSAVRTGQCIYVFKAIGGDNTFKKIITSIDRSIELGVSVINMSYSGGGFVADELAAIRRALRAGIKIVVAAGNKGLNLDISCSEFPACYAKVLKDKNFIVVGSYNYKNANHGEVVTLKASGNYRGHIGTSVSAAYITRDITRRAYVK